MSDVVAVGLITGGVGILGNILTFLATKRTVEAENIRVREDRAEAERQHRQGTYHQFSAHMTRYDAMMAGWAALDEDKLAEWGSEFFFLLDGLRIFGHEDVRARTDDLLGALRMADAAFEEDEEGDKLERHQQSYMRYRQPIRMACYSLTEAMRADVARDLVSQKTKGPRCPPSYLAS